MTSFPIRSPVRLALGAILRYPCGLSRSIECRRQLIRSPITVGTIAIILLFVYLRLSSNRVVAPMTLFDWLLNVALGSTLAGIVNGTSLVRGLLSLATLMAFQLIA